MQANKVGTTGSSSFLDEGPFYLKGVIPHERWLVATEVFQPNKSMEGF